MIIAIDGPSGSGKSTMARFLAGRLRIGYLDTGAMYRAFTLQALREHMDLTDEKALAALVQRTRVDLRDTDQGTVVQLNGEDVTEEIRKPYVTNSVYHLAGAGAVREQLVEIQRRCARGRDFVAEGRDMGTVVFPDAEVKFFLDATAEERARRRKLELTEKGETLDQETVLRVITLRDKRDSERAVAPLRRADDAIYVDTTGHSIEEVLEILEKKIKEAVGTF